MPAAAPTYDLMLILDPGAEEPQRTKIAADTRRAIEAAGELRRHDPWGERPLAYPIERHTSGEYHLFQFEPARTELLGELDHTLRITDGVLRFRIIKLRPGVPEAPEMHAAPPARHPEPAGAPPAAAASGSETAHSQPAALAADAPSAAAEPDAPSAAAEPDAPSAEAEEG